MSYDEEFAKLKADWLANEREIEEKYPYTGGRDCIAGYYEKLLWRENMEKIKALRDKYGLPSTKAEQK